jgi:uncharacterized repeat protein (TIGR03803 family)
VKAQDLRSKRRSSFPSIQRLLLLGCLLAVPPAYGQTFAVIHNFTGGSDGSHPVSGLTIDRGGNFYGTTSYGACQDGFCGGTVFRLRSRGSGWIFSTLYTFTDPSLGFSPQEPVTIGPDGTIFGSASGGDQCDPDICGVIFRLQPPSTICRSTACPWMETVLHRFGLSGGAGPSSALVFDTAGNMYGTTASGVGQASNDVFQMSRNNGQWVYSDIYSFTGGSDGGASFGVIPDSAGNLYGTAAAGGLSGCDNGCGTLFELVRSGNDWIFKLLYSFTGGDDGGYPEAALVADANGNLYGTTIYGGLAGNGTVFELSPANGSWTLTTLYSFVEQNADPVSPLILDSAGNLYGTTARGGSFGDGSVFKLTKTNSTWVYSSLHNFSGGSDGGDSRGSPILDTQGNLWGTAVAGGISCNGSTCGVVWEITP